MLSKIDERNRYYIFIGVLVFVSLADYVILMKPQLTALTKIGPEIKILSRDIQKAKEEIQKKNSYKDETRRLEDKIKGHSLKIKAKDEVPLILERISQLASQNGVEIDQIMPFSRDQEVLFQDNKRTYYALPILVEARSGYHGFGRFLDQLEKDNVSVDMTAFTIMATDDARYHRVTLNLEAMVFEGE
jgi:Tfp pilus assembly protein PilO